jgi:hypothetical protein
MNDMVKATVIHWLSMLMATSSLLDPRSTVHGPRFPLRAPRLLLFLTILAIPLLAPRTVLACPN